MSRPKIGIYKITNTVNDKVYVGQSHDIKGRWRDHRHKSSNAHMRNAMIKDGLDNFVFNMPHVRQAAIDSLKGKPWPEARRRAHEEKKLQSQKVKS